MKRRTHWLTIGLCALFSGLVIMLAPTASWALKGFKEVFVFAKIPITGRAVPLPPGAAVGMTVGLEIAVPPHLAMIPFTLART